MNSRRNRIILALVLFIFISLTVFTFANRSETFNNEKETEEKDKPGNETDGPKEDDTEDGETPVNGPGNGGNNAGNNNGGNVINNDANEAYEEALAAVIVAENEITKDTYDAAKKLVDLVTDVAKRTELENRLKEVETGIKLKELVAKLEQQVNDSKNLNDINDARNFEDQNEINKLVDQLSNNVIKNQLRNMLNKPNKLLNDNTAPTVNINDGDIFNSKNTVILIATDENEVKLYLTKDSDSEKEVPNNSEVTEDGGYTLRVIDEAFNETKVVFTIDKTVPVGTLTYSNNGDYTNLDVTVTLTTTEDINAVTGWTKVNDREFTKVFSANESGTITIEDLAGNTNTVDFNVVGIDKENPNSPTITIKDIDGAEYASDVWFNKKGRVTVADNNDNGVSGIEKTIYKRGKSGSYQDYTGTINFAGAVAQSIQICAKAIDKAGNESAEVCVNVNIDMDLPTATITQDITDWTNKKVLLTVTASDSASGLATEAYSYNEGTSWISNNTHEVTENKTVNIWVRDVAGNIYKTTHEVTNIDTTSPELSVSPVNLGTTKENNLTVTGTVNDLNLEYYRYQIRDENLNVIDGEYSRSGGTVNVIDDELFTVDISHLKDGKYTIRVWAKDLAGNQTGGLTEPHIARFTVDRTKPEVKVNLDRKSYMNSGDVIKTVSNPEIEASDIHLEKIVVYNTDNSVRASWTNMTGNPTLKNIKWLGEGNYKVVVYDLAGNASDEFVVIMDDTKPVLNTPIYYTDGKLAEDSIINTSKTIKVSQIELNPGEIYVEVMKKDDMGIWRKITGQGYKNTNEVEYLINVNSLEDGLYQVKISSNDKVKNNASYSYTFILDKTAPTLVIDTINSEGYSNTTDPQIHATDANPFKIIVKLNGTVVREVEATLNAGIYSSWFGIGYLSDGDYEVEAIDKIGNTSGVITFKLDRVKPILTLSGLNQGTLARSHTRTLTASDSLSGIDETSLKYIWTTKRLDNLTAIEAAITASGLSYVNGGSVTTPLAEGTYYLAAIAKDKAGNTFWLSTWGFVIDALAPTYTVTTSNNGLQTDQDVIVKITANEKIKPVAEWTLSADEKELTRTFTSNTTGTLTIEDLIGNSTNVSYKVEGIVKLKIQYAVGGNKNYNNFASFKIKFNENLTINGSNPITQQIQYTTTPGDDASWINLQIRSTSTNNYLCKNETCSSKVGGILYSGSVTVEEQLMSNITNAATNTSSAYVAMRSLINAGTPVYVRSIITVKQPTYTKVFTLPSIEYKLVGDTVTASPTGSASSSTVPFNGTWMSE